MNSPDTEALLPTSELEVLCQKWQELLRLRDWDLCPQWAEEGDLQAGELASIHIVPERKHACIYFATKEDAEKMEGRSFSLETTVIHELLHLHFSIFQNEEDPIRLLLEEQAIHAIADAFELLLAKEEPCVTSLTQNLLNPANQSTLSASVSLGKTVNTTTQ